MTGRWRAVVLVVLLGAPAAACSDDGPGEGEAHLEVDGKAIVERADGDRETVDDSTDLERGDRVTMDEGVAVMQLQGGTTFELREGILEAADTALVMESRPVLEAGDLLVTTPGSTAQTFSTCSPAPGRWRVASTLTFSATERSQARLPSVRPSLEPSAWRSTTRGASPSNETA